MIKAHSEPERTRSLFDKYRSLVFVMAFLLIGFSCFSQVRLGVRQSIGVKGYTYKELAADSLLKLPIDTLPLLARDSGSLAYKSGLVWVWSGLQWDTASGSGATRDLYVNAATIQGQGTSADPLTVVLSTIYTVADSNYTVTAGIGTVVYVSQTTPRTFTLPAASSHPNRIIKIKNGNTGFSLNISPAVKEDLSTTITTLASGRWIEVQSDGTSWWIISKSAGGTIGDDF